ncbi:MAG: RNA polymerase factor sigma-54 [Deltaproteobacteria bacterium]|nr:RNA polymerase factor sigma-54 [Deltaproteobacteria bacterium]
MELKLVPKLQLGVVMTPQLKMAIKLLTLNHLELKDAVAQELVENPVLEEFNDDPRLPQESREAEQVAAPVSERPAEVTTTTSAQEPSIDWEAYADQYNYLPPSAGSGKDSGLDDLPGIDQTLTRTETLEEHLLWQVRMSDMNALERQIALRLLGEMSDDGFLDVSALQTPSLAPQPAGDKAAAAGGEGGADDEGALLGDGPAAPAGEDDDEPTTAPADGPAAAAAAAAADERVDPVQLVADELDVDAAWVEAVRRRIMRFDPVGCLSRDLRECLLTQLEVWGYDEENLVWAIVAHHLRDAERHNFQAIAKAEKVTLADVGDAMKLVEQLEPRPARNYIPQGESPDAQYITPDVYVMKLGDEWIIQLNEDGLPKLRMSRFYVEQLRAEQIAKKQGVRLPADPSRTYIKEKKRTAEWLIKSIHQRQRTIYRVCESILKYQRDWFDGNGPLKPLILKNVADDIEMHESTVSRVTSRKYLHTPRGVFELKYFFNSSINTGDGDSVASEAVKDEIKKIVQGENPKKPLSDSAIVKILEDRNVNIARRTVAKYRDELGILPSNRRKQVF